MASAAPSEISRFFSNISVKSDCFWMNLSLVSIHWMSFRMPLRICLRAGMPKGSCNCSRRALMGHSAQKASNNHCPPRLICYFLRSLLHFAKLRERRKSVFIGLKINPPRVWLEWPKQHQIYPVSRGTAGLPLKGVFSADNQGNLIL